MAAADQHVVVLVLGDIGRSPRMQYHAVSLSKMKRTKVSLVGFKGEKCIEAVEKSDRIQQVTFSPFTRAVPRALFLFYAPFKVIFQIFQLFWLLLWTVSRPTAILVQNPPSIPTLLVVWIVCRLRNAKFIIDWHNLGYTVLSLALKSKTHPFVKIAKLYEQQLAKTADAHFCVTRAMKKWLAREWDITATVLYDKPPLFFRPTDLETKHDLFMRLSSEFETCQNPQDTIMTINSNGNSIINRKDRPALIISSTSWTEDEDFGIFLDALKLLDQRTASLDQSKFPNLQIVVTGKGPEKEFYQKKIAALSFSRIRILTLWLEASDYPLLLGSADLGVCLHTSTSGLDLPMKVLDMFGCGIPVAAVNFNCLHELVRHDINGMVFKDSIQLEHQLYTLLKGFPRNKTLKRLQTGVQGIQHWPENWRRVAAPVFRELMS